MASALLPSNPDPGRVKVAPITNDALFRQGDVRIDHEPARGPDFHVPVTTARNADSSMTAKRA